MSKKTNYLLLVFGIVAILELLAVHFDCSRFFTKPLIMILLIIFYLVEKPINGSKLFPIAMVFAFLGDVFLLFEGEHFFVLGLGSFLIMQLMYSWIFFTQKGDFHWYKYALVVLVLIAGYFLSRNILPFAEGMKIPVIAYTLCISWMGVASMLRADFNGYWMVVLGAICFTFSDSVLAINMFKGEIDHGGLLVMGSYMLAQLLIVVGYVKSVEAK